MPELYCVSRTSSSAFNLFLFLPHATPQHLCILLFAVSSATDDSHRVGASGTGCRAERGYKGPTPTIRPRCQDKYHDFLRNVWKQLKSFNTSPRICAEILARKTACSSSSLSLRVQHAPNPGRRRNRAQLYIAMQPYATDYLEQDVDDSRTALIMTDTNTKDGRLVVPSHRSSAAKTRQRSQEGRTSNTAFEQDLRRIQHTRRTFSTFTTQIYSHSWRITLSLVILSRSLCSHSLDPCRPVVLRHFPTLTWKGVSLALADWHVGKKLDCNAYEEQLASRGSKSFRRSVRAAVHLLRYPYLN